MKPQTLKELLQSNHLGTVSRKTTLGLKPASQLAFFINLQRAVIGPSATLTGRSRSAIDLYRMLTGKRVSVLILTQLLIENICETLPWNTCNQKHCDETKQEAQWRSEAGTQENHKQNHRESDHGSQIEIKTWNDNTPPLSCHGKITLSKSKKKCAQ